MRRYFTLIQPKAEAFDAARMSISFYPAMSSISRPKPERIKGSAWNARVRRLPT